MRVITFSSVCDGSSNVLFLIFIENLVQSRRPILLLPSLPLLLRLVVRKLGLGKRSNQINLSVARELSLSSLVDLYDDPVDIHSSPMQALESYVSSDEDPSQSDARCELNDFIVYSCVSNRYIAHLPPLNKRHRRHPYPKQ